jgi:thiamine biosynthesis lipoprotein
MGTYYRVILDAQPAGMTEEDVQVVVESPLERVDALMSTYKKDSEVSRFNRSRETDWFPVSRETAIVVAEALRVFEESEGAFDITVGPLVDLWGFGPSKSRDQIPSPEKIAGLLEIIGSRHLQVRLDPPALKKDLGTLQIDLSGIAKGFAVDAIAEELEDLGVTNYLVDVGGEMRAGGEKENGQPWKIAIERPSAGQRSIQSTLALQDRALATSGDYRNFFVVEGRRYSHEIDPRKGQPIQHPLVSVSVLDSSCMRADAWATALIILGPVEGRALAEKAGLPTVLIVRDGADFRSIETSDFTALTHAP